MARREDLIQRIEAIQERLLTQSQPLAAERWPDMELTYPQLRVLGALAEGPKRMSHLVQALGSQSSTMTAIVERLVAKGLVERGTDPQDRRVVLCLLADRGKAVVESFAQSNRIHFERLAMHMSDQDLEVVAQAMEVIAAAADRAQTAGASA